MQKKVIFLLLAFAAMASAMAGPVTKARARQLAADFLQMRGDKELATKEPAKVGLSGMGNKET